MPSTKPPTPREHIAMIVSLQQTIKYLQDNPAQQQCTNCANYIGDQLCSHYGKIPQTYNGTDCKKWSEEIPF